RGPGLTRGRTGRRGGRWKSRSVLSVLPGSMTTVTLTPYRRVLRQPGVTRLLVFATLARVPMMASGIVLTLHVVLTMHLGYAAAGLVGTTTTLGMAIGGPWRGRALDRVGLRK